MTHALGDSDWGDWLPRAVADADPDGLALWYLGCNGFILKGSSGTTVLIDPYLGTGDPPRTVRMIPVPFAPTDIEECDAVLATHEHSDHVHGPTQGPILAATESAYYAPDDSIEVVREEDWTAEYAVDEEQFTEIEEGDSFEVGTLTIHVRGANDPDANHPVSYIVESDVGTFFHGGDARPGQAFARVGEDFDIDLGALAFGSAGLLPDGEGGRTHTKWYSDANELAEAAAQLRLDRLIPTHWDMWRGLTADPRGVRDHTRSYDHPRSVELLMIGDRTSI